MGSAWKERERAEHTERRTIPGKVSGKKPASKGENQRNQRRVNRRVNRNQRKGKKPEAEEEVFHKSKRATSAIGNRHSETRGCCFLYFSISFPRSREEKIIPLHCQHERYIIRDNMHNKIPVIIVSSLLDKTSVKMRGFTSFTCLWIFFLRQEDVCRVYFFPPLLYFFFYFFTSTRLHYLH